MESLNVTILGKTNKQIANTFFSNVIKLRIPDEVILEYMGWPYIPQQMSLLDKTGEETGREGYVKSKTEFGVIQSQSPEMSRIASSQEKLGEL